jgi:hypothetical protein
MRMVEPVGKLVEVVDEGKLVEVVEVVEVVEGGRGG